MFVPNVDLLLQELIPQDMLSTVKEENQFVSNFLEPQIMTKQKEIIFVQNSLKITKMVLMMNGSILQLMLSQQFLIQH